MKIVKSNGFTLVELMIVILVIGILASIAIPQLTKYRSRSYNTLALSDVKLVKLEANCYFSEWSAYPGN